MDANEWPEFNASATRTSTATEAKPEWTLRTQSELHVERLEAKLKSIKRKHERPSRTQPHRHDAPQHLQLFQDQLDTDAEEIQSGQEEAEEGLWLLWNNQASTSSTPSTPALEPSAMSASEPTSTTPLFSGMHATLAAPAGRSYGATRSSESEEEDQNEREDRLERAKARVKHVDEFLGNDRACSVTCCCVIS
ncbi:hypothetical protein BGZ99_006290 [Dissophora globulifera]|uniref:Uncharacterized protein n=1 Tax=Dissophora globulifera TaxID=979702 RepID=A0A9P6RHH7_9FUNG|nr:hypothetical protein BGZ99_006290 [Dissophora globulifera]